MITQTAGLCHDLQTNMTEVDGLYRRRGSHWATSYQQPGQRRPASEFQPVSAQVAMSRDPSLSAVASRMTSRRREALA